MFWPFETRQGVPGQKTETAIWARVLGAILVLMTLAATLGAPRAEARPRFRDKMTGLRLRLSGSYGWIDYDSISRASNGRTTFVSAPHLGRRGELELWVPQLMSPWPRLGLIGDYEVFPVRLFGRSIAYSDFGGRLAWRALGGHDWNKDELLVSAGPAVQSFPEVRAFPRTQVFDLLQPTLLSLKFEARARFKLGRSHRGWRADVGAYWNLPLSLYRSGAAELDKQQTRNFGFSVYVDKNLNESLDVGLGLLFEKNRLGYRPLEGVQPQTIEWNNIAPMLTIQFWLAPSKRYK